MIVTFRIDGAEKVIEVDDSKDWTDICNKAHARVFPGTPILEVDLKHQKVMAERNTPSGESSGGREVGQMRTSGGLDAAPRSVAGVRDTSMKAYRQVKASGALSKQQTQLVEFLRAHPGAHTRQEIAKATGWAINRICPRVHELLELGVLAEGHIRKCGATSESAHPVALAEVMARAA